MCRKASSQCPCVAANRRSGKLLPTLALPPFHHRLSSRTLVDLLRAPLLGRPSFFLGKSRLPDECDHGEIEDIGRYTRLRHTVQHMALDGADLPLKSQETYAAISNYSV